MWISQLQWQANLKVVGSFHTKLRNSYSWCEFLPIENDSSKYRIIFLNNFEVEKFFKNLNQLRTKFAL